MPPAPTKVSPAERAKELKGLLASRRDLVKELKPYEGRELSDEEKAAYQAIVDKVNDLDVRVAAIEKEMGDENPAPGNGNEQNANSKLDDMLVRIASLLEKVTPPDPGRRSVPPAPGFSKDLDDKRALADPGIALRGWALAPSGLATREHQEASERIGFNMAGSTIHLRLSEVAPRTAKECEARHEAAIKQIRAQSTLTAGAGANLIQTDLQKTLELALLFYAPLRQFCKVMRTDSGNPLDIPTMDDTANKGEIVTENTSFNSQDLVLGKKTLNAWLYNSKMINVSLQLLQDAAVNVPNIVGAAAGERLGRIQTDHFSTGSGTGQPAGLATATVGSSLGRTATSATAISFADILNLIHSVDRAYRTNGVFMMHDAILMQVRLIQDGLGRPIFTQSYIEGEPDRLLGYPIVINNSMASTVASGNKTILFGDISNNYLIRDCLDFSLRRLDERYAELGQVGFIALMRTDARLLFTSAVKHLIHP